MSCVKQVIRGRYTGSTNIITVNFNGVIDPEKSLIFVNAGLYLVGDQVNIVPVIRSLSSTSFESYGGWNSSAGSGTVFYQIIEFA